MGVVINKTKTVVIITGEMLRDALLAIPENERMLIVSQPDIGEDKVISLSLDKLTDRVAVKYEKS